MNSEVHLYVRYILRKFGQNPSSIYGDVESVGKAGEREYWIIPACSLHTELTGNLVSICPVAVKLWWVNCWHIMQSWKSHYRQVKISSSFMALRS